MADSQSLDGAELWPVPGFSAMGALATAAGSAPFALAGPKDSRGLLLLAGQSLELIRSLGRHGARHGLGVMALCGKSGPNASEILGAAFEFARLRGAERIAIAAQRAWSQAALRVAPSRAQAVAALDPPPIDASIDPQRLSGIPLWVASGTACIESACELRRRARHPSALIEFPHVDILEHAASDLAALLIPFVQHVLATAD